MLAAGESLPSVQEMSALQGVRIATLQHALAVLAEERLLVLRRGRTAVVTSDVAVDHGATSAACGRDAYVFSNDPMGASPWNPDWGDTRPATWRLRPV
jgi:DNA-binding transcriptional MocR family regulator